MTKLNFEIDTDSSYDEDEQENLLDAFIDWVKGIDGGVDVDSADLSINKKAGQLSNEQAREVAAGLIANGTISVRVAIRDLQGTEIHESEFSNDNM